MKRILLVIAMLTVLLMAGCNKDNTTQNNDVQDSQKNQQQEDRIADERIAYSNEQLIEMVKRYRNIRGEYIPEFVEIDEEYGDIVKIHLYDIMENHAVTSDWYDINKYTGKGTNVLDGEVDLTLNENLYSGNGEFQYIDLSSFNKDLIRGWIDNQLLDYDQEYIMGYTSLGDSNVYYDVFYKKEVRNDLLFEYMILKNGFNKLDICIYAEDDWDYAEKIFTLNNGEILGIATFNEKGDTSQNISLYDYKLNLLKNSDGRKDDFNYLDWTTEFGYEHQYGFDIINDSLIFYRNVGKEKVTYKVEFEKGDGMMYEYVYSISEISRTTDGFRMGAGRT